MELKLHGKRALVTGDSVGIDLRVDGGMMPAL